MPFARISLHRGKSAEYLQALSQGLHEALVERFEVPLADRFQIIHQHEVGELIFDPNYLGGPRSHDFVLIAITAGRPRSVETRRRFYCDLVERLGRAPGIDAEDVMVVITTTDAEAWSFGGGRGN
ncbi:putative tautomerase [Pseudomonas chlororaphis subsp. aureofaciens]|uniref:tautomerase family protein n=1 Tax=Pseudomonas chlororaphis TaxID=587753 RepID=UPI000F566AA3|nr:tautomerase family protein [Pseudomonas chlororaphis]AZD85609.1 putative tautomerase [Pseudomonas chlororaphis subsp. aureofaciens]